MSIQIHLKYNFVLYSYFVSIIDTVKPERKSLVKRRKKILNNTIIDSIITGMDVDGCRIYTVDGCYLYLFIYILASAMGWLLCTCHSTNYTTKAMRLLYIDTSTQTIL